MGQAGMVGGVVAGIILLALGVLLVAGIIDFLFQWIFFFVTRIIGIIFIVVGIVAIVWGVLTARKN